MTLLTIVSCSLLAISIGALIVGSPLGRQEHIPRPLAMFGAVILLSEIDVEAHFGRVPDRGRDVVVALVIGGLAAWSIRDTSALRNAMTLPIVGLIVLLGLGLISTIWSIAPVVTAQRSAVAIAIVIAIIGLVEIYGFPTLLRVTAIALLSLLAVSIIWEILGGGTEVQDTVIGGFSRRAGLTGSPNELGRASALLFVIGATLARIRIDRLTTLAQAAGLVGVLLAQSRTALAVALVMFVAISVRRRHFRRLILFTWFAATGLMTAWTFGTIGVDSVTREGAGVQELTTATGRTTLWEFVWNLTLEQPIIGYGAFASEQILLPHIEAKEIWVAADAHNLALNIFMTQGLIGVLALAIAPLSLLATQRRSALAATGAGPLLLALLALSITENSLRKPSIALTVAAISLAAVSIRANSSDQVTANAPAGLGAVTPTARPIWSSSFPT